MFEAAMLGTTAPVQKLSLECTRRIVQSPVINVMEILSNLVGDLGSLLLDLANDAGDRRSCLQGERRSDASRRRGTA